MTAGAGSGQRVAACPGPRQGIGHFRCFKTVFSDPVPRRGMWGCPRPQFVRKEGLHTADEPGHRSQPRPEWIAQPLFPATIPIFCIVLPFEAEFCKIRLL